MLTWNKRCCAYKQRNSISRASNESSRITPALHSQIVNGEITLKSHTRIVESLRGGLIVSCQARQGSPVYGPRFMAAFAQCAEMAGAVGFRANGSADVRAIRRVSRLPIIGINKQRDSRWQVYITPTIGAAREVVRAGAEIVAVDATHRTRKGGMSPEALITEIKNDLHCVVMADID